MCHFMLPVHMFPRSPFAYPFVHTLRSSCFLFRCSWSDVPFSTSPIEINFCIWHFARCSFPELSCWEVYIQELPFSDVPCPGAPFPGFPFPESNLQMFLFLGCSCSVIAQSLVFRIFLFRVLHCIFTCSIVFPLSDFPFHTCVFSYSHIETCPVQILRFQIPEFIFPKLSFRFCISRLCICSECPLLFSFSDAHVQLLFLCRCPVS